MSKPAKPSAPVRKRVAIIAYGPSMHAYVNLAKALGGRHMLVDEVWGINAVASVIRCDRAFHMDDVRIQQVRVDAQPDSNIKAMLDWLKTADVPVYTSRLHPDFACLVEYPLADVLNRVGGLPYFNSTPAYAVALAIAEGFSEISLFGLDYAYANSHHAEKGRACIEFWCGQAMARGIDVIIPNTSSLLDACLAQSLYGYGRFGSRDVALKLVKGRVRARFTERPDLPTADEIEREYDHSRHPSPLVSGVTQPKAESHS